MYAYTQHTNIHTYYTYKYILETLSSENTYVLRKQRIVG